MSYEMQIMNIQLEPDDTADINQRMARKIGHKQARHAAAEIAARADEEIERLNAQLDASRKIRRYAAQVLTGNPDADLQVAADGVAEEIARLREERADLLKALSAALETAKIATRAALAKIQPEPEGADANQ